MRIIFIFILASFAEHAAGAAKGPDAGGTAGVPYPDTKLVGMMGFAKKGRTVGGSDGKVFFLQNLQDLKKHITDAVPQTLVVAANIDAPKRETIFLGSNKSLIGSYKSNLLNNVYFHTAYNSSNIIFQNLLFKHNPNNIDNSDIQLRIEFGARYWIDHCTFDGGHVDNKDLGKLLSVESVKSVTISYCKFLHHRYGLILGFPSDKAADAAKHQYLPELTMMFNYFEDIVDRAPGLMRYGIFHVYNNHIKNFTLGFTIGFQCQIFSERNIFTDPKPYSAVVYDEGTGSFTDSGSIPVPKKGKSKECKWRPTKDYHYILHTKDYTRNFCEKFSGVQGKKIEFTAKNKN